ncbi:NAD-dependent protein deacetylase sirtuin-6 [Halocaridina rubra]|uniref:protein acetyllysine N-acetyltransferase n=1 Tax=Halocaridina rubra TaxID=373956 RepID=A0AAN9A0L9_HALRR
MSCNYAEGLSNYENKGKLGLPERFDKPEDIAKKVTILAEWLRESKHTVFHTGAGISTSAGIPDFRGPKGVWTLEKQGLKPDINISWDDAKPTLTHMAIATLEHAGHAQYVVTQNIDGLHLRSGLPRQKLAKLHGNMLVDKCNYCNRQFVRRTAVTTVGQKSVGQICPGRRINGRLCRGKLHDTILDWEDGLPDDDLDLAISHSCAADLSICLGTTLQIVPSGNLPVNTKKRGGKLVICNLQPTKQDRHADLIINAYVDDVMKKLLNLMNLEILDYDPSHDPTKLTQILWTEYNNRLKDSISSSSREVDEQFEPIEWSIHQEWVKDKELLDKVKSKKVIRNKRQAKRTCDQASEESKRVKSEIKNEDGINKKDSDDEIDVKEPSENDTPDTKVDIKEACKEEINGVKALKVERIGREVEVKVECVANGEVNTGPICDVKNVINEDSKSVLDKVSEIVEMKDQSGILSGEPSII